MASFLRPTALKLRNFKGITELDLTLDESLTLLAGVNGVGKTSVLQGLVAAVTCVWHHIASDYPMFSFQENVVRVHSAGTELALELELPGKSSHRFGFTVDGTVPRFAGGWQILVREFRNADLFLPLARLPQLAAETHVTR